MDVQLVAEPEIDSAEVVDRLGIIVGEPLDPRTLRDGIRSLYRAAEVEYLRVETEPAPGGVIVIVHVRSRPRLEGLTIEAPLGVRRLVRAVLELERHEPVSATEVETAVDRAVRALREAGYPAARIEPFLDYDRMTNTARLRIEVDPGERATLSQVVLAGVQSPEVTAELADAFDAGKPLTESLVERARRIAERELRRHGFWEARVTGSERRPAATGSDLLLLVDPGPHYELEIGAAPGTEDLVRAALPTPSSGELHPAQTELVEERLRERLQRRGYLLADVDVGLDGTTLHVRADPGTQRRVTAVELPGADSLDREVLLDVLRVRPGRTHGWRGRPVTEATLEADRRALEDLYRRSGFAEVGVAPAEILPEGPDGVTVRFPVEEGRRWTVHAVQHTGFPVAVVGELEEGLITAGDPWDPRRLESERRRLEGVLHDVGHPDARIEAEAEIDPDGAVVTVLTADTGPYVRIGEVTVTGLDATRPGVVERELRAAGVETGRPLARDSLLDAQRRLFRLGLFRRVEIRPMTGQELRTVRDVEVELGEGKHRSYLLGLGWDTENRARLTLGWSHLNLFGAAHALSLETRLSDREERYQASLRVPRLPAGNLPGYLVVYRTEESLATYSQFRRGLWLEAGERRRRPLRSWLRYEYQIVRPDAPPEVLSELERQEQEIELASVTQSVEWDLLDDPLSPRRGLLAGGSLEWAFPAFRAEAEFLKLQGRMSLYRPVLGGTGAVGVRAGAIRPFSGSDDEPWNLRVPLATRFFGGGRVSHRAFARDRLGVPGETLDADGDPIGGTALLLLNMDWIFPIRGVVSGVLFADGGNVWSEPSTVDLGDWRWGVGAGLRVDTPAGPLRLEYGRKLDPRDDESGGELFLSFGVPF